MTPSRDLVVWGPSMAAVSDRFGANGEGQPRIGGANSVPRAA